MPEIDTRFPAWLAQKNWATSDSVSRDLQTGFQLGQRNRQMDQQNRELLMREAAQKLKTDMLRQQAEGSVALGIIMEQATQKNSWTDPQTRSKVYSLARQYPWLAETDLFKSTLQNFEHADMAQKQLDQILLRHSLDASKPEPMTADVKNIEQLSTWKAQMRDAVEAGDFDTAEGLKTQILQLEQQLAPSNQTIETFGPEGQIQSRIRTGKDGAAAEAGPTTGAKTFFQKRLSSLESSINQIGELEKVIDPSTVGLRGVIGEQVMDRVLGQFAPDLVNPKRADARTKLKAAIQGMVRLISTDDRFSNEDRRRAEDAMVSAGAMESYDRAVQTLSTLKGILARNAAITAKNAGVDRPEWSYAPEDIAAEVQAKRMSIDEGQALLDRLYPNWKP